MAIDIILHDFNVLEAIICRIVFIERAVYFTGIRKTISCGKDITNVHFLFSSLVAPWRLLGGSAVASRRLRRGSVEASQQLRGDPAVAPRRFYGDTTAAPRRVLAVPWRLHLDSAVAERQNRCSAAAVRDGSKVALRWL